MLKNVVFDLDGTLWQTTDSYVYAYHKLCDFYGLKEKVVDDVVKTYLGVRLDKLLNELLPTVEDKHTLAYRALGFSVEYSGCRGDFLDAVLRPGLCGGCGSGHPQRPVSHAVPV